MQNWGKTLLLLGIASFCALAALFVPLKWIGYDDAVITVKLYGYWLIVFTALLAAFYIWQTCKKNALTANGFKTFKTHRVGLIVILLATAYLHLHSDRSFKILYDEHALSSTAMSMHQKQHVLVQAANHTINGETINEIGFVDKRPNLFPFAISLTHSLTGYRMDNVFWLNSALTALLLSLVYALLIQTTRSKSHAILGVLLLTGLPLLAQNTNGAGYELLNLCLICGLISSGIHYMKQPGETGLNLLIIVSILLANTRYESMLYVLVPAALFLLKSFRERTINLTGFSVVSPLLLILPLLSYRIFQGDQRFIQTTTDNFFSLEHLPNNLAHAVTYLFDASGDYSNSILLSATGLTALLFLFIQLIRRAKAFINEDNNLTVPFIVFAVIAINTSLALSCYWGAWTDPATSRFSLPLQLFFACSAAWVLHHDFRLKTCPRWMLIGAALFIVTISSAHTKRLNDDVRLSVASGYDWALQWISTNQPNNQNLYLAESTVGIGLLRQSAIPFVSANQFPERILLMKELNLYDEIYTLEVFYLDSNGTEHTPGRYIKLNERFELECVAEKPIRVNLFYRISRVIGLKASTPDNATKAVNLPREIKDGENITDYLYELLPLAPQQ